MSAILRAAHLSPAFAMDSIPVLPLPRTAAADARSALRKFPDMVASVSADRDSAPTVCMTLLVAGDEIAAWAGPASRLLKRPTRIRAADALMLTSWARCLPLDVDGKAWGSVCLPSFSDSGTLHGFVKYCGSACRGPRRAALAAAVESYEAEPSEAIQRVALTPHVARAEAGFVPSSSGTSTLPSGGAGEEPADSAFRYSNVAAKRTIRDASQRTMETVMEMYGAEPSLASSATPRPNMLGESTPMRAGFSDSESEGSVPDCTPVAHVASLGAVNSEVRRSWPSGASASSPTRTGSFSTASSAARTSDGGHPLAASEALLDDVLIVTVYTGGMGFSLDVMHAATDALRASLTSSHVLGDISKLVGEDGLSTARVGTRSSLAAHVHREFATSPRHAVVLNCSQKQHFTFAWPEPDMPASERRYMLARYTALWARMRSHDGARSTVLDAASDPGRWTWVAYRHADWVALTQWPSLSVAPEHILMSCKRWCEAAQEALAHFTITLA